MWKSLCLAGLVSCSNPTAVVEDTYDVERSVSEDPQYAMAKIFDDLLQNRLDTAQQTQLDGNCQTTPQASIFCYAILNRKSLVEKTKEMEREAAGAKYTGRTIRPRFSPKNEVLNWAELKGAATLGVLRGLPKDREKRNAVKTAAIRETECPNNAAIAVAGALEDQLPEKVGLDELGRLYEKGGRCIKDNPTDREAVLTRAGLMYLANGSAVLGKAMFQEAANVEGTFTGRALYWLYRCQTKLGETSAANATLEKLQSKYPFSFHSLVAQTAAGRDPGDLLSKKPSPSIKRSRQDSGINQLLESVEILHRLGFDASGSTVLGWAVALSRGVEPEVMLYLAELKEEQGDTKSKITILSDLLYQNPNLISRQTLELYFPKVLFPVFEKSSNQIDPYFLLAIARRESAFDPKAVSSANAKGLLQILPSTGRRIKKRPNLLDPETNVAIGTKYILELLKRTNGQIHLALAAYNAGPGKLRSWTKNYPTDDPILFVDLIPFKETREYVGSVLRNYYWYRRIHKSNAPIPPDKILELAIADKE